VTVKWDSGLVLEHHFSNLDRFYTISLPIISAIKQLIQAFISQKLKRMNYMCCDKFTKNWEASVQSAGSELFYNVFHKHQSVLNWFYSSN